MRITIDVDSATPEEIYDLTLAFQRTAGLLPATGLLNREPTVTVGGSAMGWKSPPLTGLHVQRLLENFVQQQVDRHELPVGS